MSNAAGPARGPPRLPVLRRGLRAAAFGPNQSSDGLPHRAPLGRQGERVPPDRPRHPGAPPGQYPPARRPRGVQGARLHRARRATPTFVKDLGSSNGTYVNGRRIREHRLKDGDEITLGNSRLTFHSSELLTSTGSPGVTVLASAQAAPAFLAQIDQPVNDDEFRPVDQLKDANALGPSS